jgi:hypothetical protein
MILASGIRELPLTGDIALAAVELERLPADPAESLYHCYRHRS